ncbi:Histone-arginine methyltransferase CARMER [Hondaea fermentalgiana]|uniref:type I protein arginine methyltransferase n=1 Tax=Hondaea fermentalgiana TaxID=2315210 RepID=A0A2R5GBI6_9STRA|nr:Histone-arginine methyltransferase CARMER [Hondaea fermentalgiana]|eukprot:GBG25943.1 Histone-arginine methyltransferase CARMER [Hondaea fermentalgiana]
MMFSGLTGGSSPAEEDTRRKTSDEKDGAADESATVAGEEQHDNGKTAPKEEATTAAGATSEEEHPFFHYYGQLAHQQNMLQDHTRTGTYQRAIYENPSDFADKVVLDVGTGTGILAIFAARAGARKVYAVEASDMADCAERLVRANNLEGVVEVVKGKLEDIELPEKVDVIISEPMGFLLVHERMLESYVLGRKRFLRPGVEPKMFPSRGTMYFLPFSDYGLYAEQYAKAQFWSATDFYGVDLSSLADEALKQHFLQPVVGAFDPSILISDQEKPATSCIDFETSEVSEMLDITVPFEFVVNTTTLLHGIAGWFDVDFIGSHKTITLSTGPYTPFTHWHQCRMLLPEPIAVNKGQTVEGTIHMVANEKFSYTINLEVALKGTDVKSSNVILLQEQFYHYLQGSPSFSAE